MLVIPVANPLRNRALDLRLDNANVTELLLGVLSGHGGRDDDIITGQPVDGGGDTVLVGGLEGVNNTEYLSSVTASGGGVGDDQTDLLLGVNNEDGADGESNAYLKSAYERSQWNQSVEVHTLRVDVGGVIVVDHVILVGNLALGVGDDGELQVGARNLIDILDPLSVGLKAVGALGDSQSCPLRITGES